MPRRPDPVTLPSVPKAESREDGPPAGSAAPVPPEVNTETPGGSPFAAAVDAFDPPVSPAQLRALGLI